MEAPDFLGDEERLIPNPAGLQLDFEIDVK
jgi:hypothetical protein